jgi:hypothetical protein
LMKGCDAHSQNFQLSGAAGIVNSGSLTVVHQHSDTDAAAGRKTHQEMMHVWDGTSSDTACDTVLFCF